jgi:NADH-quinone oxidoreductase subunit F
MPRVNSRSDLEKLRKEIQAKRNPNKPCISISSGTCGRAFGSERVYAAFEEEIKKRGLEGEIDIKKTGCLGFCERGTLVVIYPEEIFYTRVQPKDAPEVVRSVKGRKIVDRLLYTDPVTKKKITCESEIPFYKAQQRIISEANRWIDPRNIEDYVAIGGYIALSKAIFEMTPEEVLEEIKGANLRGRGGGGFPTGRKWETTKKALGEPKYVIVNCDEGDPGAYMDRSLMEGNPHSVLEGLIIGAYTIGAHEGYIYIRNEYPLAVENLRIAVNQAEEYGFLGANILGSGFDFRVRVNRGGGAFVCGESSALMASLEGRPGEPRAKYIHAAERGLWDRPTNLNNVETWANVPQIILKGADWYRGMGTDGSKGTKIFSLVGKVNNTGLVEVPMGISLREIIYDIGGGIRDNKKFKAVQTGGPSGGFIPESLLDLRVDFDEISKVGSMMGSGGMIVMDEGNCMVDMARYFLSFLEGESCGKCVPCREGIKRMRQILTDITEGRGKEEDIELLERLSSYVAEASLCALGRTAPNPVLTSLRYFRDEYEAHIKEKRCPAKICKELISYHIIDEKCPGCGLCVKNCPVEAITFMGKRKPVILDQSKCIKCGICFDVCKLSAIEVR